MGIDEDVKKIENFSRVEKEILSPAINDLTILELQNYQKELTLNVPQLEEMRYRSRLKSLNSTIQLKINEMSEKENKITASKRFLWQMTASIVIVVLAILTLYLRFFYQS